MIKSQTLLFVCTGNICRSPMAEYLLRDALPGDTPWRICSAGTSASDGIPASPAGIKVLAEAKIDMTPHRSRTMTREHVDAADLIVVMTKAHQSLLLSLFPKATQKTFLLKSFDLKARSRDLADPIGAPVRVYQNVCEEIKASLPGLLEFLDTLNNEGTR